MKRLFFAILLLFCTVVSAEKRIEFNGQTFFLKSGNCMTIIKGDTCYTWQIESFSNAAEMEIARKISELKAFDRCRKATDNCGFYDQGCYN